MRLFEIALVQTNSMPECQGGKISKSMVRALIHVKQPASSWGREKENLSQRQSTLSLPSPIQHPAKKAKAQHHRLPSALVPAVISKGESCGLDASSRLNHCSKLLHKANNPLLNDGTGWHLLGCMPDAGI